MYFSQTQSERSVVTNGGRRGVVLLGVAVVVLTMTAGVAAAQPAQPAQPANTTAQNTTTTQYQLGDGVTVRDVEWTEGGTVRLTVETGAERAGIAVTDAGSVQAVDSSSGRRVSFEVYRLGASERRTIVFRTAEEPLVTVQAGGEMIALAGDRGGLNVIQSGLSLSLVQIAGISGIVGSIMALSTVITALRRREDNSLKELTSDNRKKIEKNRVQGWVSRAVTWVKNNQEVSTLAGVALGYVGLVALGVAPGPGQLWASAGDTQRVIAVGSIVAAAIAALPVYLLVQKIWDPEREYVVELDAEGVVDAQRSSGAGGEIAVWAGSPERVSELELDGGRTRARTPGGPATVVRDLDVEQLEATTTWPGQASDPEILRQKALIEDNRHRLKSLAEAGEELIKMLPSLTLRSDASSAMDIDRRLREQLSPDDGDAMDAMLRQALETTDYAELYSNPTETETEDTNTNMNPEADTEDERVTNDDQNPQGDDVEDGGPDGSERGEA